MGEIAFRFLQGSLESSKGSNVAATTKLLARVSSMSLVLPRDYVEEDRGTLVAANRYVAGVEDNSFSIEGQATFEQLPWFLQTASRGSVAPSTVNTAGKRVVFSPNTTTTGDDLQAASFEFGDDDNDFLATYAEVTDFEFGFDALATGQSAPLTMRFNYVAKSVTSNTRTSGLSNPTVETIAATGSRFYLGDTSTGYGSLSEVTGSLRAFRFTSTNNLGRKVMVGDGATYSLIGRGRRVSEFEATIEGDSTGILRWTEWKLGTQKRMRLVLYGANISGASPATARELVLDGRFDILEFDPIGEIDTNTVFMIKGRFVEDTLHNTTNSDYTLTITNDVASYT